MTMKLPMSLVCLLWALFLGSLLTKTVEAADEGVPSNQTTNRFPPPDTSSEQEFLNSFLQDLEDYPSWKNPILDTIVATAALWLGSEGVGSNSLEEILKGVQCALQSGLPDFDMKHFVQTHIYDRIPLVIQSALNQPESSSHRRALEVANETIRIADNYAATIQMTTLPCFSLDDSFWDNGKNLSYGAASYPATLLWSQTVPDTDSIDFDKDFNMSLLLETNVLEMTSSGIVHWPAERNCLDLLPPTDKGSIGQKLREYKSTRGKDRDAYSIEFESEAFEDPISVVGRGGYYSIPITKYRNGYNNFIYSETREWYELETGESDSEISWEDITPVSYLEEGFVPSDGVVARTMFGAYRTPKPELEVLLHAIIGEELKGAETTNNETTNNTTQSSSLMQTYNECVEGYGEFEHPVDCINALGETIWPYAVELNLTELDGDWGVPAAAGQFNRFGRKLMDDSFHFWLGVDKQKLSRIGLALPFLFATTVASIQKNNGDPFSFVEVGNPYYRDEELPGVLGFNSSLEGDILNYCYDSGPTVGYSMAGEYLKNLKRRLYEAPSHHQWPPPLEHVMEWGQYFQNGSDGHFFADLFLASNFLNDTVDFGEDPLDGILLGNLTERKAGKTAEFLLASNFPRDDQLQGALLYQRDEREQVLSRSLNAGTTEDQPCSQAATNEAIFLFVLSIATAACGGVQSIVGSLHTAFYVLNRLCCGSNGHHQNHSGYRFLPTYELMMAMLAMAILGVLYVPVGLQLRTEYEVARHEMSNADMQVYYFNGPQIVGGFGYHGEHGNLVTLVHTRSFCESARPELLLLILVIGVVLGAFINIPLFVGVAIALKRYAARVGGLREASPPSNTSMHHQNLRLTNADLLFEKLPNQESKPLTNTNSGSSQSTPCSGTASGGQVALSVSLDSDDEGSVNA